MEMSIGMEPMTDFILTKALLLNQFLEPSPVPLGDPRSRLTFSAQRGSVQGR
jgi:hypothetical protein